MKKVLLASAAFLLAASFCAAAQPQVGHRVVAGAGVACPHEAAIKVMHSSAYSTGFDRDAEMNFARASLREAGYIVVETAPWRDEQGYHFTIQYVLPVRRAQAPAGLGGADAQAML